MIRAGDGFCRLPSLHLLGVQKVRCRRRASTDVKIRTPARIIQVSPGTKLSLPHAPGLPAPRSACIPTELSAPDLAPDDTAAFWAVATRLPSRSGDLPPNVAEMDTPDDTRHPPCNFSPEASASRMWNVVNGSRGRMLGRSWVRSLFMVVLLTAVSAHAEHLEAEGGELTPAPPTRRIGSDPFELNKAKEFLKTHDNVGSAAWWNTAHAVLGEFLKPETKERFPALVDALAKELGDAKDRSKLFTALATARVSDDVAKLRQAASAGGNSPDRLAAREELMRRVSDPNVALVSKLFSRRPELAMGDVTQLIKADPAKGADLLATMMGRLNTRQRQLVKDETDRELRQDFKAKGLDERLLKWINAAAKISLGEKPDESNPFQKEFKPKYDVVRAQNENFWNLVSKAKGTDATAQAARAELLAKYPPEELTDFIPAQMLSGNDGAAVDLARATGRRDAAGNVVLDVVASNAAFREQGRNQTLFLGASDEQIRASLTAFHLGGAEDHDETGGRDTGTQSRFQRFALNPSGPGENPVRLFAAKGTGGRPELKRRTEAGWPGAGDLGTEPVVTPSPAPATPVAPPADNSKRPPGVPPGEAETARGLLTDAVAAGVIQAKCAGCHVRKAEGGFAFTASDIQGKKAATLETILNSMVRDMTDRAREPMPKNDHGFRDRPEGAALCQWLRTVLGKPEVLVNGRPSCVAGR